MVSNYAKRYRREDFDTHINITHRPTGFKFYQAGGRINVIFPGDDGIYRLFTDFTIEALQIEHTVLTEPALRAAAVTWLKDYLK